MIFICAATVIIIHHQLSSNKLLHTITSVFQWFLLQLNFSRLHLCFFTEWQIPFFHSFELKMKNLKTSLDSSEVLNLCDVHFTRICILPFYSSFLLYASLSLSPYLSVFLSITFQIAFDSIFLMLLNRPICASEKCSMQHANAML